MIGMKVRIKSDELSHRTGDEGVVEGCHDNASGQKVYTVRFTKQQNPDTTMDYQYFYKHEMEVI